MKRIFLVLSLFALFMQSHGQERFIKRNGQDLFLNGINLAWINYANDLGSFNEASFIKAVTSVREAGGNTIRWWMHVNGNYSPQFSSGKVTGIKQTDLDHLKRALDIAAENGVVLDLCLWSFGMLDKTLTTSVLDRNTKLLTDTAYTNAYINKALLPMVRNVKGHPGLLCWEIFNEPEGMSTEYGWSGNQHVDMLYIQKFVNLLAGAIHREDSTLLVSNGIWTIQAATDVDGFKNFYRPDRLKAAGGDSLGTLDFYMVHYYTSNGTQYSPFRKPASHWQLDKPIAIGEFPAKGLTETGNTPLTPEDLFAYAYDNGYAGALTWTYTGHDGNGGLPECASALMKMAFEHTANVVLNDAKPFNFYPYIKNQPYFGWKYAGTKDTIKVSPLLNYISDKEDSSLLVYTIDSVETPVTATIDNNNTLILASDETIEPGVYTTYVMAKDTGNKSISVPVFLSVIDNTVDDVLLNRPSYASSNEGSAYYSLFINDTSEITRWSSEYKDNQTLLFVLDKEYNLQRMMISWEAAFGQVYNIELSTDSTNWTKVFYCSNGNGGYDKIVFAPTKAKYVRVNFVKRGTQWGYSIFSFKAFENTAENQTPVFSNPMKDTSVVRAKFTFTLTDLATDPDLGDNIRYSVSVFGEATLPTFFTFNDSTNILIGRPTATDTGSYKMIIKATDMEGAYTTDTFELNIYNKTAIAGIKKNDVKLYPNPVSNKLYVENAENLDFISIFTTDGKLINKYAIKASSFNGKYELNVSQLNAGNYLVHLQSKSGNIVAPITVIK